MESSQTLKIILTSMNIGMLTFNLLNQNTWVSLLYCDDLLLEKNV